MNLDGFFFNCLVAELNQKLKGSRVEDVYDTQGGNLILQFRAPGRTLRLEISIQSPPYCFFLTDQGKRSKGAGVFSQTVKKHVAGQFCVSVQNPPFDRMATLAFGASPDSPGRFFVNLEIMGRQNDIILCQDNSILASTRSPRRDSVRPLQPGDRYSPPPGIGKLSPDKAVAPVLYTLFSNMGNILIEKALVKGVFGISPLLAREICHRSGIDPGSIAPDLDNQKLESLCTNIQSLSQASQQSVATPVIYEKDFEPGPYWTVLTHLSSEPQSFASLSAALEFWNYSSRTGREFNLLSERLQGVIVSAAKKLQRTLAKQQLELERAHEYQHFREIGDTLLANIHTIPRGADAMTLDNVHTGAPLEITLNPDKSASSNASLYYKKYNKYKNAMAKVNKQIDANKSMLQYLGTLEYAIESSGTPDDLREIQGEMTEQGLIKRQKTKTRTIPQDDYQKFISPQGDTILVGKNNRQNEVLTLRKADKEHYWLHTRHFPGSHVILCSPSPDNSSLEYAASLAAWYSKGKMSPKVEVVWTQVKNVKKIPGAAPGMVNYYEYRSAVIDPRHHLTVEERQ